MSLNRSTMEHVIYEDQVSPVMYIGAAIALGFIGFFGFTANLLVAIVIVKDAQILWTPVNVILFNLVVSDEDDNNNNNNSSLEILSEIFIAFFFLFLSFFFEILIKCYVIQTIVSLCELIETRLSLLEKIRRWNIRSCRNRVQEMFRFVYASSLQIRIERDAQCCGQNRMEDVLLPLCVPYLYKNALLRVIALSFFTVKHCI